MRYSEAALQTLRALTLTPLLAEHSVPIHWLSTLPPKQDEAAPRPTFANDRSRVERIDFDCGWRDLACLEDVIPDVSISSKLAAMVTE